jgi:hypothetical protein
MSGSEAGGTTSAESRVVICGAPVSSYASYSTTGDCAGITVGCIGAGSGTIIGSGVEGWVKMGSGRVFFLNSTSTRSGFGA